MTCIELRYVAIYMGGKFGGIVLQYEWLYACMRVHTCAGGMIRKRCMIYDFLDKLRQMFSLSSQVTVRVECKLTAHSTFM